MQVQFCSGQLGGYLRQLTLHQSCDAGVGSNSGVGIHTYWDRAQQSKLYLDG
jgi:hypothetical protein